MTRLHSFNLVQAIRDIFHPNNNLDAYERLVLSCLSRHADAAGECFPSLNRLARECSLSKPTVWKALYRLEAKNCIRADRSTGRVTQYQITALTAPVTSSDQTGKADYPVTEPGNGVTQGGEPSYPVTNNNQETALPGLATDQVTTETEPGNGVTPKVPNEGTKERKDPPNPPKGDEYTPEFEQFWAAYPRRKSKQQAFRVWRTRLKDGHAAGDMVQAAVAYAGECLKRGVEPKYRKLAATFIGPDKHFTEYVGGEPESESELSWIPKD